LEQNLTPCKTCICTHDNPLRIPNLRSSTNRHLASETAGSSSAPLSGETVAEFSQANDAQDSSKILWLAETSSAVPRQFSHPTLQCYSATLGLSAVARREFPPSQPAVWRCQNEQASSKPRSPPQAGCAYRDRKEARSKTRILIVQIPSSDQTPLKSVLDPFRGHPGQASVESEVVS